MEEKRLCLAPVLNSSLQDDFGKSYNAYMKKHRLEKRKLSKLEANKVINKFLELLALEIAASRTGVLVKRIGYFTVYRHPFVFPPRKYMHHLKDYRVIHISNHRCIFKYYMMDYFFNRKIQKDIDERVKNGQRYINLMMGVAKKNDMYIGAIKSAIIKRKEYENQIK